MDIIRKKILSLPFIKRIQNQLKLARVPGPEQSISIIIDETIKNYKGQASKYQKRIMAMMAEIFKRLKLRRYHYPIQYLTKYWYFRQLTIKIAPPLLIPRFQTENLVSLMIQQIRKKWPKGAKLSFVDFCCGTGVIGLSLLKQLQQQYDISGILIDISPKAIKYTKINAQLNGLSQNCLQIIQGNMLDYLHLIKQSQIILSNPPYLSRRQYSRLQKQVKLYEDPLALQSGEDGMQLVNPLVESLKKERMTRSDFIAGIEFSGRSVQHIHAEAYVVNDQYGRRRYLIF